MSARRLSALRPSVQIPPSPLQRASEAGGDERTRSRSPSERRKNCTARLAAVAGGRGAGCTKRKKQNGRRRTPCKGVAVPIPIRLRCWWRSQKIESRFQPCRRTRENRLTPVSGTRESGVGLGTDGKKSSERRAYTRGGSKSPPTAAMPTSLLPPSPQPSLTHTHTDTNFFAVAGS